MPTSEARIRANQINAARSTGPKTAEGKARSRANALKHGMTGAGVVLPDQDAAEVARLTEAFTSELKPEGEVGAVLVRRMAVQAVRMDRCVLQESASLSGHVREAADEFEAPVYVGDREVGKMRALAGNAALFDASAEAALARKYEAACERSFFRALKELRQMSREAAATVDETPAEEAAPTSRLASFFPAATAALPALAAAPAKPLPAAPSMPIAARVSPSPAFFDIPMAIGRAR